jgi:CRP-like cAMP-binding protein
MSDQQFSSLLVHQPKWIRSKNQKIINMGDPTDRLFWIEQGKVRRTRDGRLFMRNSFVEVVSFFGSDTYSADVISLAKTEVRVISRSDVMRLFEFDKDPILNELVVLLAREKLSAETFQFLQVG